MKESRAEDKERQPPLGSIWQNHEKRQTLLMHKKSHITTAKEWKEGTSEALDRNMGKSTCVTHNLKRDETLLRRQWKKRNHAAKEHKEEQELTEGVSTRTQGQQ